MRRSSEVLAGRPCKNFDRTGLMLPIPLGHDAPTSFRIAREDDLEKETSTKINEQAKYSTFGVQSLADTIYDRSSPQKGDEVNKDHESEEDSHGARRRSTLKPRTRPQTRDNPRGNYGEATANTADSSPTRSTHAGPSPPSLSHSLTSLSLDSQAPLSSLPSTPKSSSNRSFRHSDEESMDEGGSQAVVSSEDDEIEFPSDIQDSAPQLVMPSIKLPSRRPFTERGKAMGRLKVLVAGDSGVGKTSLIKSIVQTCEDIVHVDPLSPNLPSLDKQSAGKLRGKRDGLATQHITEVYASTKPYPSWWSDIEDAHVLRRRKSVGDNVLDRNICFVDTPGYSNGNSRMESMQSVLHYIEAQLFKPFSAHTASEGDIASLLSGNGGPQVDVVLYLMAQELKDEDMAFLTYLTAIAIVIPLIAKSDTQSLEEIEMMRRSIDKLQHDGINLFNPPSRSFTPPYTVSSAPADDSDIMDASTLMSPEYVKPLVPSELTTLVHQVFEPDNLACLRHLAARKLVKARRARLFSMPESSPGLSSKSLPDHPTASSGSSVFPHTESRIMISHTRGMSPYVHAKVSDHTQQEERLAQIRLAKWAGDLQRSLQNERARYESIARGERAMWLTARLNETTNKGVSVDTNVLGTLPGNGEIGKLAGHRGLLDPGDPLGLLRWNEAMKRRGWFVFGVGVLGAVTVWMARTWDIGSDGYCSWTWSWFGKQA